MSFSNVVGILGVLVSLVFGVWSILRSNKQQPSRAGLAFLLLAFLYGAQIVSAKWLGHAVLPDATFTTIVTVLVIGIYWLIRDY
jgi:thiol:disulfide interchange protein